MARFREISIIRRLIKNPTNHSPFPTNSTTILQHTKYFSSVDGITNYPSYHQLSENDAVGREQTFQADYYDPLTPMHQVEGRFKIHLTAEHKHLRNLSQRYCEAR